jgi:hypothetical protein
MSGPLVNLDLKHVEEKNSLQVGSPVFLLQTNKWKISANEQSVLLNEVK